MATKKNEHAQELAKLGAAKGGQARAAALAPEARREIARAAARARWGDMMPTATHTGELRLGTGTIACAVLDNGKRVLTQEAFLKTVGRAGRPKGGTGIMRLAGGLPPFLAAENLLPFVSDKLRDATVPIAFRTESGNDGYGYDAALLPMVCDVYLNARASGKLHYTQNKIAERCEILKGGLAHVGIIALVDEATGYQDVRARDELHRILEAYVVEELRPWIRTFPDEFFRQIYRLQGWSYNEGSSQRPRYIGKVINKYIYKQLPPGVLDALRKLNPTDRRGYRRWKHFQFLTPDTGNPHLDNQIRTTTTLLRVSDSWAEFDRLFAKAFGKPLQEPLPLITIGPESASEPAPAR